MTDFIAVNAQCCIGCRTCEVACALAHAPLHPAGQGTFTPRLTVLKLDTLSAPVMCRQCESAPCAASCPTGALSVAQHVVNSDPALCIGCKNCIVACPFGCITIDSMQCSGPVDIVKCDLCQGREAGPACVEVCPTRALEKRLAVELQQTTQKKVLKTARGSFMCRF